MIYDRARHAYFDGDTQVPESRILSELEEYSFTASLRVRDLLLRYKDGGLSRARLEEQIRDVLREQHIIAYAVGRGGRLNLTYEDWGRLGYDIRAQYRYLDGFMTALDDLSLAQAQARGDLYFGALRASYYRGKAADHNLVLPAYPGDGSTECGTNCRCAWLFEYTESAILCFWTLGRAEHCASCVARSTLWSPYVG